ncbi:hypothetical protein BACUNI_01138 [Bacteroides uniformis ATCC 8492]|uniref:Uncharacterized protein n=1 Tax=Bacteroides uniformis (strain ATCC 8492 / DSM 6597 / CCUG 4942 / CIP 103695 / JCM 5828 / KCTC 5204 / NCTC 13054 / VPI 0061) TaxID=411479 RepID=A0ABC9NE95_BACUC|nr:hypothetical protein BACUNI_01138 [Bacteroides uniformis ATCC 8492]
MCKEKNILQHEETKEHRFHPPVENASALRNLCSSINPFNRFPLSDINIYP